MKDFYLNSVALAGPGLADWQSALPVLRGERPFQYQEPDKFVPQLLRPNERRRTTALIRLALQVAEQTLDSSPVAADQLCSVFASSEGDTEIVDKICSSLTLPDHPVSPTQFHNSVHNAPAGYWAIATKSRQASSSISAGRHSFAVGLIEATCLAMQEQRPVLLVCYDLPAPEPLREIVNVRAPFACALLLSTGQTPASLCRVSASVISGVEQTGMKDNELEQLRCANPAAYSLPLLRVLADAQVNAIPAGQTVYLPYGDDELLSVECHPC